MNNFIVSLQCIAPIFINLAIGYAAKCSRLTGDTVYAELNKVCFYTLIPFLVFDYVYRADFSEFSGGKLVVFSVTAVMLLLLLAMLLLSLQKKEYAVKTTYLQNAFRSNLGIISIAIIGSLTNGNNASIAIICIAILTPLYNVLSVLIYELHLGKAIKIQQILLSVIKNPIIVATLLGASVSLLGIKLPETLTNSVSTLGKTGSTLSVMTLGARFDLKLLKKNTIQVFWGCITRLVIVPALVLGCGILIGFRRDDLAALLAMFAAPLATNAFTMAQVYKCDEMLAGQIVVFSSAFCCVTYCLWIFLLKELNLM